MAEPIVIITIDSEHGALEINEPLPVPVVIIEYEQGAEPDDSLLPVPQGPGEEPVLAWVTTFLAGFKPGYQGIPPEIEAFAREQVALAEGARIIADPTPEEVEQVRQRLLGN